MITIREIAQAAGVSVSTASIVLRGESEKRKVAPATTEKVLQVAQALDYTPNVSARRLRASQTSGFVVAIFWASFWAGEFRVPTLQFLWAYMMLIHYVFAVQAQFENTIKNTIVFALALAIRKLGWTVIMLCVTVLILIGGCMVFLPLLILAPGLIPFFNSYILNRCFKPYLEEAEKKTE